MNAPGLWNDCAGPLGIPWNERGDRGADWARSIDCARSIDWDRTDGFPCDRGRDWIPVTPVSPHDLCGRIALVVVSRLSPPRARGSMRDAIEVGGEMPRGITRTVDRGACPPRAKVAHRGWIPVPKKDRFTTTTARSQGKMVNRFDTWTNPNEKKNPPYTGKKGS